tara:strand:+ start:26462 stop:27169 length:708 start_codon:yes stop_codon:yes gene_type:complete
MGSSRLPGKTLLDLHGMPMILRIIERLNLCKNKDILVVATTTNPKDDELVNILKSEGVNYFRGSEEDVLSRVYLAAKRFSIENIIELHGDNPFLDPDLIDKCIHLYERKKVDYLSNTLKKTFPMGLRVQVFSTNKLGEVYKDVSDEAVREHVSLYFYENPDKYKLINLEAKGSENRPDLRLTVDTREDFEFISNIYKKILEEDIYPNFKIDDVIRIVDQYQLRIINQHIISKPVR